MVGRFKKYSLVFFLDKFVDKRRGKMSRKKDPEIDELVKYLDSGGLVRIVEIVPIGEENIFSLVTAKGKKIESVSRNRIITDSDLQGKNPPSAAELV